jgi:hypothetical protein
MSTLTPLRQFAESVWEFLWLVAFGAALWMAMFFIPWDEAMAAGSLPEESASFIAHLAFAGGLLSICLAVLSCIGALEMALRRKQARRSVRKAARRARTEAQSEPFGDASLYGRRP